MSDFYTPTAVAQEALDSAGIDFTLGNITEGSRPAQILLRKYTTCLHQLLRTAHWDFARKSAPLQVVAAQSGQWTDQEGNLVPVPTMVPAGFLYSYSLPIDSAKIRFIPANYWGSTPPIPSDNITPFDGSAPLTNGNGTLPWLTNRLIPSRFLLTSDPNYIPEGASNDIPGVSPIGQTLICSNVPQARAVYTFNATYPNLWDSLFRGALVAFLASEVALPLSTDKKFGMTMRKDNIAVAMQKIQQARVSNGNESWANSDLMVDWMRVRASGGYSSAGWASTWGQGPGILWGGYDGVLFSGNTSAF